MDYVPQNDDSQPAVCPRCVPDYDPRAAPTFLCHQHQPSMAGAADPLIDTPAPYSTPEIDATTNRAFCALLHRPKGAA